MSQSDSPLVFFEEFLPSQFALRLAGVDVGALSVSPLGVVMRVLGAGQWTLSIAGGELSVQSEAAADCALQLTVTEEDFATLFVQSARRVAVAGAVPMPEPAAMARRLGRWDSETTALIRAVKGSVLLKVADAGTTRAVAITPGSQQYSLSDAACTVDCRLEDLRGLQDGSANPLGLLTEGHLRIGGDAQIVMGLAGIFL